MKSKTDNHASDLQGATRIVIDAVVAVTDIVEHVQTNLLSLGGAVPSEEGKRLPFPLGFAHSNVRVITKLVGAGLDIALAKLSRELGEQPASPTRDLVVSAVNGVLGDYLQATDNPLALHMELRLDGRAIEAGDPELLAAASASGGKLLLMIHGSSANDGMWQGSGHNHGTALARDLGFTVLYLNYNSGLHISDNGRELSEKLSALFAQLPSETRLTVVAHSMGGLITRSAMLQADAAGDAWPDRVDAVAAIGTPHQGAPLERAGNWLEVTLGKNAITAPFRRLGELRSAGVTDLRYGYVHEADWADRDRFDPTHDNRCPAPLRDSVRWFVVAGTVSPAPTELADSVIGDGIVPLDSALGRHEDPKLELELPESHRYVARGVSHRGLLYDLDVYEKLKGWLSSAEAT